MTKRVLNGFRKSEIEIVLIPLSLQGRNFVLKEAMQVFPKQGALLCVHLNFWRGVKAMTRGTKVIAFIASMKFLA